MADDDDPPEDEFDPQPLPAEQPTVDAASVRTYRSARVGEKRRARDAATFWRNVFADPVGRYEMWGILASAHAFEERFACGPNGFPQPEATWFNAGQQALGQRLYQTWMQHDFEGVHLMLTENDSRFAPPPKQGHSA